MNRRVAPLAAAAFILVAKSAAADGVRVEARAGVGAPVGSPQSDVFGLGGGGALSAELPLVSILSAEADAGLLLLSPSTPPPGEAKRSLGTISLLDLGVRLRPLGNDRGGPWIGGGVGLAVNGSNARFGGEARLGWDLSVGRGRFRVGPFVAYTHVLEPGATTPAESDAHVVWGGVAVSFGGPDAGPPAEKKLQEEAPLADRDGDGVGDAEDACPDKPGVHTNDINTNGCPPVDTDHDGITDDVDACPAAPGPKRDDPKTNGCPDVQKPDADIELD